MTSPAVELSGVVAQIRAVLEGEQRQVRDYVLCGAARASRKSFSVGIDRFLWADSDDTIP